MTHRPLPLLVAVATALLAASGCAPTMVMIDGVAVPRVTTDITGQAISVKHRNAHPKPGGASSGTKGDGGSIGGVVCGMQVDYDISHEGDHIQLIGFIDDTTRTSQLQIRDEGEDRIITGNIVGLGVELRLGAARVEGHVGTRVFFAERDAQGADRFVGHVRVPGLYRRNGLGDGAFPVAIDGREYLMSLPPAEQAALLPTVLTCWWAVAENVPDALHVGFGGEATAQPPNTSSVYGTDARITSRPR